jgi:hypothetical protein
MRPGAMDPCVTGLKTLGQGVTTPAHRVLSTKTAAIVHLAASQKKPRASLQPRHHRPPKSILIIRLRSLQR